MRLVRMSITALALVGAFSIAGNAPASNDAETMKPTKAIVLQHQTNDQPQHFWHVVGTDPLKKGLTDQTLAGFMQSARAKQCAAKLHVPTPVYMDWVKQARKAASHHTTMRSGASFDLMAFGNECSVEAGVLYDGVPVGAWNLSTKWKNKVYTATIPFGCGNLSITVVIVPGPPAPAPVTTSISAASAYDHSNSAADSHASGDCGTADASSDSWSWARATAFAVGYGSAFAKAKTSAYAKAQSSAHAHTNITCKTPSPPPPPPPVVVTYHLFVAKCNIDANQALMHNFDGQTIPVPVYNDAGLQNILANVPMNCTYYLVGGLDGKPMELPNGTHLRACDGHGNFLSSLNPQMHPFAASINGMSVNDFPRTDQYGDPCVWPTVNGGDVYVAFWNQSQVCTSNCGSTPPCSSCGGHQPPPPPPPHCQNNACPKGHNQTDSDNGAGGQTDPSGSGTTPNDNSGSGNGGPKPPPDPK